VNIAAHGDRIILNTNSGGVEAIYHPSPAVQNIDSKHVTIESGTILAIFLATRAFAVPSAAGQLTLLGQ
jgi:hypothetical protein